MKLTKEITEIEKDCLKLERDNQMTEYAQGQLDLIKILRQEVKSKEKYSIDDVMKVESKSRLIVVGLIIANELNKISIKLNK